MSFDKQPDQDTQISFDDYDIPEIVEPRKPFLQRYSTILILAVIFILAGYFRFTDTNFDQGTNQHPDEIAIVSHTLQVRMPTSLQQLFDASTSPLNLRVADRYPWGAVPVYIARAAAWVADSVASIFKPHFNDYYLNDYHGAQMVGRITAGIFDLFTLLLTFLIARRLFSTRTALIATALVAFSVTNIQISHFYITEPFLVAFMMAALYFTVILMQKPSWWAAIGAGFFVGLSVASKVSSALIFIMIIAALVLRAAYRRQTRKLGADLGDPIGVKPADAKERGRTFGGHFVRGFRYFLIATVLGVIAFGLGEPYALWQFDFSQFRANQGEPQNIGQDFKNLLLSNPWSKAIVEEAATQGGGNEADIPYTRQYVGTVPVLYQFEQIVFWGVGVVPGIIILAGLILALWLGIKRRPAEILLLSYAVPYFATLLLAETKWMRYSLPLIPVFCILGASFLVRGAKWAAERWPKRKFDRGFNIRAAQRAFFPILTASAIIFAFLWSSAYMNVYSQDHTRVQAAAWLNDNAPAGSKISSEGWDAGLPNLIGMDTGGQGADYGFNLYDDHPVDEELNYIHGQMNKVDYITINSDRLYQSISRMPWRYPVQIAFYQNLYAGKLGFQLVHTEQVVPSLFGISVNDQLADESFTVYDHPRVDIFKKVTTLTDDQMSTLFSSALDFPQSEYSTARHGKVADDKSLMYDQPLSDQPDVGNYAWNPLAQNDTQWFAVLFWLVAVYLISIAAMPIVFTVFKRLPDRGYAFAKLAGLVIVTYGVWLLASGHVIPFTTWSVLLMLLALFALAVILWRMGAGADIRQFMREKRNLIFFYEGLFLLTFAFLIFIRILNPDVWHTAYGGEKTMEIGFLNGALRSPWMPPADPFFAGGYTNYYYQGQFIIACLIKLVGVDPAIAYNLSFPLLFGLCFTAAASIVYNLVAFSRKLRGSAQVVSRVGMAFGALAGILFLFIGNMHSLFEWLLITFPKSANTLISIGSNLGMIGPSWTNPYTTFNFWDPSRIIPGTINEFPYWSFLYGDLHPHLIDMCFTLFATFLALNLVFAGRFSGRRFFTGTSGLITTRDWIASVASWLWGKGGAGLLAFGVTALSLGGLFVTNSWDYPTFAGLTAGAVLIAVLLSRRVPALSPEGEAVAVSTTVSEETADAPIGARGALILTVISFASLGALVAVSLAAYLPFFLTFKAFFTKLMFITDGAPVANGGGAIMHRTTIWEFLVVWGIFVFISLVYLLVRLWSFPWRDALVDLFGIVPSSGQASQQTTMSPTAAVSYENSSLRKARPSRSFLRPQATLQMTPSFASATAGVPGSIVAFMGSTPEDNAPQSSAIGEGGSASPVHAHDMSNGIGHDGSATAENGAAAQSDGRLTDQQIMLANGFTQEANGHSTEAPHNWVADAHTEVQRERRVVDRTIDDQPGIIPLWLGFAILVATAALTVLQIATGQPLMALLVLLIGGISGTLLSTTRSVGALGGGLLLVVALIITIGLEMVYLADHLSGGDQYRSNTVFKFYIQAWVLFAVGGAVAVYYIFFGVRDIVAKKRVRNTVRVQTVAPLNNTTVVGVPASQPVLAHNGERATKPLNGDTAPLSGTNTIAQSRNWLVWSTDAIEDVSSMSNGADTVNLNATRVEPLPASAEPAIKPVVTRRLRRAVLPGNGQRPSTVDDVTYVPARSEPRIQTASTVSEIEEYAIPAKPVDLLRFRWSVGNTVFALFFAFFLFVGFLYPLYGTPSKLKERVDPSAPLGTLSGLSYMQNANFTANIDDRTSVNVQMKYDLEGINWLNQNVTGLHTIAELPLEYYRAGGMRVASNTGLPMVIGGLHQEEQRADEYSRLVGDRRADMNTFYTTSDVQMALTLISKYDIEYIYLGQVEQAKAGEQGVKKFAQMADPKIGILSEVFHSDNPASIPGTIIYEVNHGDKDPKNLVGAPVAGSGIPGISITPLPTSTPIPPPTPPVDDPTLTGLIAAVSASPNSRDARQNLVDWYRDNNYPLEAAQELEIMVQQNPSDIALRSALGDMYQSANMPDKALKAWEDARDVAPNNPDAHNKLGLAYYDRKRYDDALTEYQAAVAADPHFVESWFHLGEVYERKGDADNAKKSYQSVIDNSTDDNSWKVAAQDKLNSLQ